MKEKKGNSLLSQYIKFCIFGFHQPPLNRAVHLHPRCWLFPSCLDRWKHVEYSPLQPLGGFIETEKLLEKMMPLSPIPPWFQLDHS
ncbi:hypothetical protein CRYUN_Cryun26dG0097100 [Craigia yunnanensis]